jgi:hypothetical protein
VAAIDYMQVGHQVKYRFRTTMNIRLFLSFILIREY